MTTKTNTAMNTIIDFGAEKKLQVAQAMLNRIEAGETQSALAKKLGTSDSYISQIIKAGRAGDVSGVAAIAQSTWRKLWADLGLGMELFETSQYRQIEGMLKEAKYYCRCGIIDGHTGMGKTVSVRHFATLNPNATYVVRCSSDFTAKELLREIARVVGVPDRGTSATIRQAITRKLEGEQMPLLIIDEAENIRESVYGSLKDIYDDLEGKAAIVLCGANDYVKRLSKLAAAGKRCFPQIVRRYGSNTSPLGKLKITDVRMVSQAFGIENENEIKSLFDRHANFGDLFEDLKQWQLKGVYKINTQAARA